MFPFVHTEAKAGVEVSIDRAENGDWVALFNGTDVGPVAHMSEAVAALVQACDLHFNALAKTGYSTERVEARARIPNLLKQLLRKWEDSQTGIS